MHAFRRYRRITWAALWALVFAALAPTVPALHGDGRAGSAYADLCITTPDGQVGHTGVGSDGTPSTPAMDHGECALCAARGLALAGPPASVGVALRLELHDVAPVEPTSREVVQVVWSPANPRAPPPAA
ncbi:MAG: DUF2946 family protein [Burkholderiales bacterium]|jgi:hypothetical protein